MTNQDLGKTQITDKVRVSSAAIFYDSWFGDYFQVETWIFSSDPSIKSKQVIHGTCSAEYVDEGLLSKCKKAHLHISNNMQKLVQL